MPEERDNYATRPALTADEWYAEHQQPKVTTADEVPDVGVSEIEKMGSIVKIRNNRGREVWIGEDLNKKALAAIALRSFTNRDGSPIVSHAMVDRLAAAGAAEEDIAVLRSLLPPTEFESST